MSKEQHVQVEVSINGNANVSFISQYGWVDKMCISIDAVSLDDAKSIASEILINLDIAPSFNDSGKEEEVRIAGEEREIILNAIDELSQKSIDDTSGETLSLSVDGVSYIEVKFKETYEVIFG